MLASLGTMCAQLTHLSQLCKVGPTIKVKGGSKGENGQKAAEDTNDIVIDSWSITSHTHGKMALCSISGQQAVDQPLPMEFCFIFTTTL